MSRLRPITGLCLGALACGSPAQQGRDAVLLDRDPVAWRLEVVTRIGVEHGDPRYELDRAGTPRLIGQDRIAVTSSLTEIRIYSIHGEYVRTIGREGDGPGEFRYLLAIHRMPGDTLVTVHGDDTRKFVLVDTTGARWRTVTIDDTPDLQLGTAVSAGSFAALSYQVPRTTGQRAVRDTSRLLIFDRAGDLRTDSVRLPGKSYVVKDGSWTGRPLGAWSYVTGYGDGFAYTPGDVAEIRLYSADGRLESTLRSPRPLVPVNDEHLETWDREMVEGATALGMRVRGSYWNADWEMFPPEHLPAWSRLIADDAGCIWAQQYREPGSPTILWDVIDPATGFTAVLEVPRSLSLSDVRHGRVVSREADELGVQRLVVLRILRSDGSASCRSAPRS